MRQAHINVRLRRYGWELARTGGSLLSPRPHRTTALASLPPGQSTGSFRVPISRVTSVPGFAYSPGGWHPYIATLRECLADPDRGYAESALYRLHTTFCPRSVQELLLEDVAEPLAPICDWPAVYPLYDVWIVDHFQLKKSLNTHTGRPARGAMYFGPRTFERGSEQFAKLLGLLETVRKGDYDPQLSDDPIHGYFLVRDDEYRFVAINGNHRLAVLAVTGHTHVDVHLWDALGVVDHDHLQHWTRRKGGMYPDGVPQQIFNRLFDGDGRTKAQNLGLLGIP